MILRNYEHKDCDEIYKLFYDTVHSINAKDYSKNQLAVWAKKGIDSKIFCKSFIENYTIIVEENRKILGFGNVDDSGYLDMLYVHKDFQHKGIATMIVSKLETYTLQNNIQSIKTHASITVRPFFEKRGYIIIKEQQVIRDNIYLTNYIMEKLL